VKAKDVFGLQCAVTTDEDQMRTDPSVEFVGPA
jgi:hypothetical protein